DWSEGLITLLVVVSPLIEEPNRPLRLRTSGSGCDERSHDVVPGPILLVGSLQECVPSAFAPPLLAANTAAAHEQHIPNFAKVTRGFVARKQPIHQGRALVVPSVIEERQRLFRLGNAPNKVERHPPNERAVVANRCGGYLARPPTGGKEIIDSGRRFRRQIAFNWTQIQCGFCRGRHDPGPQ